LGAEALKCPQVAISTFDAAMAKVVTSTSIPTVTETSATGDGEEAVMVTSATGDGEEAGMETSATGDDEEAVMETSISSSWMLASEMVTSGVLC